MNVTNEEVLNVFKLRLNSIVQRSYKNENDEIHFGQMLEDVTRVKNQLISYINEHVQDKNLIDSTFEKGVENHKKTLDGLSKETELLDDIDYDDDEALGKLIEKNMEILDGLPKEDEYPDGRL